MRKSSSTHRPLPKLVLAAAGIIGLTGCVATHERPMNDGERTFVSEDVAALLDDNDGTVDTREYPDILCRRYKLVGTHMVTRVCYSRDEDEEMAKDTGNRIRDRWGAQKCLSQTSVACQSGLEGPRTGTRRPN